MRITLITVCFNSAKTLETALESVWRQKHKDIEYWVIDGGSRDGTQALLAEWEGRFGGKMRWISESDRGMYDALNKGLARATGEVIGILNADDVLSADGVIGRVVSEFEEGDEGVDVVFGDVRFIGQRVGVGLEELRAEVTRRYYCSRYWRPWMLRWGYMPPHPSVYIRRVCYEQFGGYSLDYRIAADYALLVRFLWRARLASVYMPLCVVDMRLGGMSTKSWRSNLLLNQEIVRGNREAGYFCCLPMLLPKYVFKVWGFVVPRLRSAMLTVGER